jgi:hypothetical protein
LLFNHFDALTPISPNITSIAGSILCPFAVAGSSSPEEYIAQVDQLAPFPATLTRLVDFHQGLTGGQLAPLPFGEASSELGFKRKDSGT